MAGRPTALDRPDVFEDVCQDFVVGTKHAVMAEKYGVNRDTIGRWKKNARVKARTTQLMNDRVHTIVMKVDAKIIQALEQREDLTVQEILAIRKEFLGGALRETTQAADAATIGQAQEFVEDPESAKFLDELREMIESKKG